MVNILKLAGLCTFLLPSILCAFCFEDAGREYNINAHLLESIATIESNLAPKALSKNKNGSVDIGLMQVNSIWVAPLKLDRAKMISDPCYNTMVGASILKQCINRYGYAWEAVGCYNAADPAKKAAYSWKVFNKLKANHRIQPREDKTYATGGPIREKTIERLEITEEGPEQLPASEFRYIHRTANSEFFLNVRDSILETQ